MTVSASTVSWIIGGGSGIGEAAARTLAQAGDHVIVSGRRAAELNRVVAGIRDSGGSASAVLVDVSDGDGVTRAARSVEAEHGAISTVVFSAGTNVRERFWSSVDAASIAHVMDVNLQGAVRVVHAALPRMRETGGGRFVLVSSWAAWRHSPGAGVAYSMSKTALGVLAESINDQERHRGISATHLCPGEVATDILDTRLDPPSAEARAAMLRADDVGEAIAWIAAQPHRVCVNELVLTPTANFSYN